jgi:hypothetical protein
MDPQEVSTNDVVNCVEVAILSGPEDDIWDVIFDWIQSSMAEVISSITSYIRSSVDWIVNGIRPVIDTLLSPIRSSMDWVRSHVGAVWDWVVDTYNLVSTWVSTAYNTVSSAVSSAISVVQEWVVSNARATWDWITREVSKIAAWITTAVTNLSSTISVWFSEQWTKIAAWFSDLGSNISTWFSEQWENVATFFTDLWLKLEATWTWLTEWMTEHIVNPIDEWWGEFLEKIFDFGAWVGGLLGSVWDWLQEDVPGSSPRIEGIFKSLLDAFLHLFWMPKEVAELPWYEQFFYSGNQLLEFVGKIFNTIVEGFMEALEGFIAMLGPTNPDIATDQYKSIASIGMTALAGLAGMTLASSWLKPLGGAGMGQIAAMIYDMTNYKIITGAAIGVLTVAAIRTPLGYHFNELFRPNLIPQGDFLELMSRKAFVMPENLQNPELTTSVQALTHGDGEAYMMKYLGYRGFPDTYFGMFKELANAPLRYFPLAGIARTGFFERVWFTEALQRSGYSETAKAALMVMYEKMRDEALQGAMSGAAVTRFKEGFTDEVQFQAEMELLGYSVEQFQKYLAAAKIDYATDYLRDLLTSYRDGLRKGHIDMDEYRNHLLKLGVVPERVEAYVLKERARLKPEEELTPLAPPKPAYETEAGKLQVDTIRRQRRKNLVSRDQEIAGLLELGMDTGLATATANNDDVRLAEKGEEG